MHLIKVAGYAAIVATAFAACPGVVNGDCPPHLQKRSVIELDDGQLTPGRGEAAMEISDGQIIAGTKSRVQQAPDGQIASPKTEEQEQKQEEDTTVINVVTENIPVEPMTRLITVTGSSNNTSNETIAAPLPPFANTTKTLEIAIITSDTKVIQITVAPFANTTITSETTLMTLTTQVAEIRPANTTCPLTGRCPNLTQNRRGYVFGDSVISQQMVAFNNDAPALCDAQNGCVAYQIGPMMLVNSEGFVNSNPGAPRANSQESVGSTSSFAGGSGQGNAGSTSSFAGGSGQGNAGNTPGVAGGSSQGNVAPNAGNEGIMMAMVNLLDSSPGNCFDQAANNADRQSADEFVIYDHVCNVSGAFPNCVTGGGVGSSATTSSGSTIPTTIASEVSAPTLERSSIQAAATSQPQGTETSSSASASAESINSISLLSTQQPPTSSLSSSLSLSTSPSSSSSLGEATRSSTVSSQGTSSTISQPSLSSTASQPSSTSSTSSTSGTMQTTSSGSDLPSRTPVPRVSPSSPASSASSTSSILSSTSSTSLRVSNLKHGCRIYHDPAIFFNSIVFFRIRLSDMRYHSRLLH